MQSIHSLHSEVSHTTFIHFTIIFLFADSYGVPLIHSYLVCVCVFEHFLFN